jgi:hypothetical protein
MDAHRLSSLKGRPMRSAIGFFSLLACGFLAAGVLTVVGSGSGGALTDALGREGSGIHLESLLLGLMLGCVLSALARVSWTQIPRRFANWLLYNERNFYRIAWAGLFIGILVFY